MKAAYTLHCLPLLEYKSFLTQETALSFKNFLATWSIMEINKYQGSLQRKKKKRLARCQGKPYDSWHICEDRACTTCAMAWLFAQVSYKEPFLYVYTTGHAVIWRYLFKHTPRPPPSKSLQFRAGRRHLVHTEGNEGGTVKNKSWDEGRDILKGGNLRNF